MSVPDDAGAAQVDQGGDNALVAVLTRERAGGFRALGGSHAEVAIPVRQPTVDRLLARALTTRSETSVEVELLEGARLGVVVTHKMLGLPVRARTVLEVEREVDLERHRVVLHHDDGALWKTIRTIAATLGLLPEGVTFGAGAVQIDLRSFAARGGWADLLPLVRRLVVHGPADGLFALEVDLAVPEAQAEATPRAADADRPTGAESRTATDASSAAEAGGPGEDAREWLRDLAGSRARLNLHVHESLANELLGAARSLAASSSTHAEPPLPSLQWTAFVRDARVGFVDRRLLLSVDLEVPDETVT